MKRLILSIAVMTALLGFTAVADAGTASTTLNVSFTAVAACTVSTTAVNFGSGTGLTDVLANGDVTVNCASGTPYHIALDAGLHTQPNMARAISNGTNAEYYTLSKNNSNWLEWGDSDYSNTYSGGSSLADTGSGSAQAHTVYGYLYSSVSALPAGAYSDTVTVTVYY